MSGSGVLSSSWVSPDSRAESLPAVRQKFHLTPCAKIRDHLSYPLCHYGALQRFRDVRRPDILDAQGLRVRIIARPRRVSLNSASIGIRQPAPRNKAHSSSVIHEENRGALAPECTGNRIKSGFVDVACALAAIQSVGELMKGGLHRFRAF